MAKRMSIDELRSPDAVQKFGERTAQLLLSNQKILIIASIVVIVAVGIISAFVLVTADREQDASYALALAMSASKGINLEGGPTDTPAPAIGAPRSKVNIDKSIPLFEAVVKRFPGTFHAQLATLALADALAEEGKDPGKEYRKFIAESANVNLKDAAALGLAYYLINNGKKTDAVKLLEGRYQRKDSPLHKQLKLAYAQSLDTKGNESRTLNVFNELYVDELDDKVREDIMNQMREIKDTRPDLLAQQ